MFPFTLQQLRILKAIATEKNFTKAADLLYLSQPSLSKQIKTLEKNLKVSILHRETNQISLTEQGKILLNYSERILVVCEECCRVLTDLKTAERGTVTIGASPRVSEYFLPKVLDLVRNEYPSLRWNVRMDSTSRIIQSIQEREMDLGLVCGHISKKLPKNICIQPWMEDEISLIVPKSHGCVGKGVLSKDDLYHLKFISLTSPSKFRNFLEENLRHNEIDVHQFKIILQVTSMEAIKIAVKLGLGAAFVASSTIANDLKGETIQVLPIENITITQSLFLLHPLQSSNSQALTFWNGAFSTLQTPTESGKDSSNLTESIVPK